jgi:NADPH2:quinone reductase
MNYIYNNQPYYFLNTIKDDKITKPHITEKAFIKKYGGPENFIFSNEEIKPLEKNEVLIKHSYVAINMLDNCYLRGIYDINLPCVLGSEGVGTIIDVGDKVDDFKIGMRVSYCTVPFGSYAHKRKVDKNHLIRIPDEIDDMTASASIMRGVMAYMLSKQVFSVRQNSIVMINGAAGGIGHILSQLLHSQKDIAIIGLVGNSTKIEFARQNGCHVAYNYNDTDIIQKINHFTEGIGVFVVFDGIGLKTYKTSLSVLSKFGFFINFGQSSGALPPLQFSKLRNKSLFVTCPYLYHYKSVRTELVLTGASLFQNIQDKIISPHIHKIFPFHELRQAHQELMSGNTTGVILLKF